MPGGRTRPERRRLFRLCHETHPDAAVAVTAGTLCDAAVAGTAGMVVTVLLLYGLAVVVWRSLRAPPLVVEYPEGAILE